MPLDFLLGVMRDPEKDDKTRIQAALGAAQYLHAKLPPKAKKDAPAGAAGAAGEAGRGKFRPGAAPLRVVGAK